MTAPKIDIDSFWLPKATSTLAGQVDTAWNTVLYTTIVFFLLLMVPTGYFLMKYRRKKEGEVTSAIDHSTTIEVVWTTIPLGVLVVLFFVGLTPWVSAKVAPAGALEINVTAKKWNWSFQYPDGTVSAGKLIVPKGKPVKLTLSSVDVIHSFYVPEFRIKQDAVPGLYTSIWFEATEVKDMTVLCTEYCGNADPCPKDESIPCGHSDMLATVSVLEETKFKEWLETGGEDKSTPPAERGKALFASWGCATCHSLDGSKATGPTLKAILGKKEELADGSTVTVDENYLRESILVPTAKQVKGFPLIMPTFQGQLKPSQVDALIAFLKEQK